MFYRAQGQGQVATKNKNDNSSFTAHQACTGWPPGIHQWPDRDNGSNTGSGSGGHTTRWPFFHARFFSRSVSSHKTVQAMHLPPRQHLFYRFVRRLRSRPKGKNHPIHKSVLDHFIGTQNHFYFHTPGKTVITSSLQRYSPHENPLPKQVRKHDCDRPTETTTRTSQQQKAYKELYTTQIKKR